MLTFPVSSSYSIAFLNLSGIGVPYLSAVMLKALIGQFGLELEKNEVKADSSISTSFSSLPMLNLKTSLF